MKYGYLVDYLDMRIVFENRNEAERFIDKFMVTYDGNRRTEPKPCILAGDMDD